MTRLEFAKLISKNGDYKIKSHNFGDCVIGVNQYISIYEPDAKMSDAVIAWFKRDCVATYLDYINNPSKYDNAPFETYEKIDREAYMVDSILSFINIDKTMEV